MAAIAIGGLKSVIMVSSPSAYTECYANAREHNPARADNYIRHTTIGDPELDPLMEELASSLSPEDLHRFVGAGIEQHQEVLRSAPRELRDFFDKINTPLPGSTTKPLLQRFVLLTKM